MDDDVDDGDDDEVDDDDEKIVDSLTEIVSVENDTTSCRSEK